MILLVVWPANGDGSALTSKASFKVNLLNDDTLQMNLCDRNCATVIVSQTNRARCTLYRIILGILNEESVSGVYSVRASL